MIYLEIEHTEDDDFDLFTFETLDRAVQYIKDNNEVDWNLSDRISEHFTEDDYTYIR